MGNPRLIDLTGKHFGSWLVVEKAGNTKGGAAIWLCLCECGNYGNPNGTDLRQGKSTNCGCIAMEKFRASRRSHGESRSRLHYAWKNMRQRCGNPSLPGYKNYGGRGIVVCAEWDSFIAFRDWALNNGYLANLTLERVNVNGGYNPANCTWANYQVQARNRRFVKKRSDGVAWCQVAVENGIKVSVFNVRRHAGWTDEQAATLPIGSRRKTALRAFGGILG